MTYGRGVVRGFAAVGLCGRRRVGVGRCACWGLRVWAWGAAGMRAV